MSWFRQIFGREPGERRPEFLTIAEGQEVVVEFLEDEPRVIKTRFGQRGAITVKTEDGQERTLLISHVDLGEKLWKLQQEHGTLAGLKVMISRVPSTGRRAQYIVKEVSE